MENMNEKLIKNSDNYKIIKKYQNLLKCYYLNISIYLTNNLRS